MDRQAVHEEMEQARASFHQLWAGASEVELRRGSTSTHWTNQQLLLHMLLGYLIMRALMNLVRVFGRLPDGAGRAYARLLTRRPGPSTPRTSSGPGPVAPRSVAAGRPRSSTG